ncbi:hypothetical protein [Dysgonomonas sp. Marseille-P4361]|uniref:hypothetical protein n=1 Tax=Dysgonomonas sp. Marseille-P4361 TaxID=2161820 RepID=UPI000D55DA83|nr:hypothetical protein [Dysgonomonas sp. Marseille-P4361]
MKIKLTFFLLCLLLITNGSSPIKAQVTIGSNLIPEKAAILDIKEIESKEGGVTATKGGLVLPRVNLEKKYQLYPFIREAGYNASNFDDPDYDPNADATYAAEKPAHKGLIVYNLTENDDEELCLGLNQWDGEKWNCFQEKMGNAIAELGNCDSLQFIGQYQNKVALGAGNYMTIPLHVKKAEAYTLTARPSPDNGYYFTASGVFLTPGYYFLSVPGAGTPVKFTPEGEPGDLIKIAFNNKPMDACNPKYIVVEDSSVKPLYTMLCGKTKVHGVYQMDKELTDDNYITVTLNVDIEAIGAKYIIETNTVDGIYFKGQGLLTTVGEQTVVLQGYGTPTNFDDKVMTITSNSVKSKETCKATVPIAYSTKTTYGWGWYNNTAGYIMQIVGGKPQGTRLIADADINFGTDENSAVRIVKHSPTQTFNHQILSGEGMGGAAYEPARVKDMFDQKPEIVLVGFDLAIVNASDRATIAQYMVDYLKEGGVMILALERDYMMKSFCEALYPGISVSTTWRSTMRYQMGFMDDEILKGPFGDIRGKYWGNDMGGAISVTGLPEEDLIVYSRDENGKPIMFKHKYFNLFWIGEGGVFANYNGTAGSSAGSAATGVAYPVAFDNDYRPMTRTWTGGDVENGRLYANILAWAIKQAQFNGINTPK